MAEWLNLRIPFCLLILLGGCSFLDGGNDALDSSDLPSSELQAYATEVFSQGFEFCPDSYLDLEVIQIHENPQFNFFSKVFASGTLELDIKEGGQGSGMITRGDLLLTGDGWAGICQFTSAGQIKLDLQARLIPGEDGQPALMFSGDCQSSVTSKPPCGDFGMIPLEKKVFFIIPYREGGTAVQEWHSRSAGLSGTSTWTLHIPCEN